MPTQIKPKEVKWQPQHFPVGTVVALDGWVRNEKDPSDICIRPSGSSQKPLEITVAKVLQNDLDSWILISAERVEELDIPRSFNITHVTRIVRRGEGPLKIVYWYDNHGAQFGSPGVIVPMQARSKRQYHWTNTGGLIGHLCRLSHMPKSLPLRDGFAEFLMSQTFIKKSFIENPDYVVDPEYRLAFFSVDKKKVRKFFNRNVNRWLMPVVEIQRRAAEAEKREYDHYLEEGLSDESKCCGCDLPFNAKFKRGQTSCIQHVDDFPYFDPENPTARRLPNFGVQAGTEEANQPRIGELYYASEFGGTRDE